MAADPELDTVDRHRDRVIGLDVADPRNRGRGSVGAAADRGAAVPTESVEKAGK